VPHDPHLALRDATPDAAAGLANFPAVAARRRVADRGDIGLQRSWSEAQ
jgi:hypothetical protein